MRATWREFRDALLLKGVFDTFNTINHGGNGPNRTLNEERTPLVKSAESAESRLIPSEIPSVRTSQIVIGEASADSNNTPAQDTPSGLLDDSLVYLESLK